VQLHQLKIVRAPPCWFLAAAAGLWLGLHSALALSGLVAHLSRRQCPTEHPPAWAVTGCGTVLCRSAPGLGWVANGGPAGSAGSTGSGPASEDYSMHGGLGGDVGAKATGSCSRWTAFRTVSTVHQAHLLLVCLCSLPARSLYPSLPCDRSGHSHGGPRILRGYAYHPRDNENIQRRWHHVGPLLFARCKTWLLQSAAKCWVSLSVIW